MGQPDDPLDEAVLVACMQFGSPEEARKAFGRLFTKYKKRLLRYLANQGLSEAEVEDVASEAWLRVWRSITTYEYRPDTGFFPWLWGIARNVAKEEFRKRLSTVSDSEPKGESQADLSIRVMRQELRESIQVVLADASNEDHRLILELLFIDGYTPNEIMELCEWSRSKVDTTKLRAVRWMKKEFTDRYGSDAYDAWFPDA